MIDDASLGDDEHKRSPMMRLAAQPNAPDFTWSVSGFPPARAPEGHFHETSCRYSRREKEMSSRWKSGSEGSMIGVADGMEGWSKRSMNVI